MESGEEKQFLVIDDLFKRYTILVGVENKKTSVYCEACEHWIATYDGDAISRYTETELMEKILADHQEIDVRMP
jgi:hypothetical protein